MANITNLDDVILLFENYGIASQNLHTSFLLSGFNCPALVIEDDGFLPEYVISIYGYYLGDFDLTDRCPGKPLYFNQVPVPEYWEISGNNSNGKIMDMNHERARIYYTTPTNKRLVKTVDWLDEKGLVRYSDHYNQYGALFARTCFDSKQKIINKAYFSAEGKEVITENFVTGDIILDDEGVTKIFHNRTEFVKNFIIEQELHQCRIFYNTLSIPYFVSEHLPNMGRQGDVLFWQENARGDVPGNMQNILNGTSKRTEHVIVQKRDAYEGLICAGADEHKIMQLGYVYPFQKENGYSANALICTNSDNIEQIDTLAKGLPKLQFHIMALTEMSGKLLEKAKYPNVKLYPAASRDRFDKLLDLCDFYLDINHENEILSAVSEAFLYNQLIYSFEETAHQRDYVADSHIYKAKAVNAMVNDIKMCMREREMLDKQLQKQHDKALAEKNYDQLKVL